MSIPYVSANGALVDRTCDEVDRHAEEAADSGLGYPLSNCNPGQKSGWN